MNLIDRYILKQFVNTLLFSIVALCVIFVIVNLLENLEKFLDQNASFLVIIKYYIYFLPDILQIMMPVATLLATLFTIGNLSTKNEITAMKSGGLSLYRLMVPIILFNILLSLGQLYFNGWIVPNANEAKRKIEMKYLNKNDGGTPIYNLYFRDTPTVNILMQYYEAELKKGNRVSIEEFSSEFQPRLVRRIEANTINWDSVRHKWILKDALERTFSGNRVLVKRYDSLDMKLSLTHDDIKQLKREPKEMNFDELRNYIKLLEQGGKDVRMQLIDYYGKWAFPFANIIVVLFGVPFASVRRKGGIAIQIGAAMIVSFAYMIFTKVSQTISFAYGFDPILAGWIANIIFLAAGIITIFRTKT
jgi:lipopolysaccharide export system permease protein